MLDVVGNSRNATREKRLKSMCVLCFVLLTLRQAKLLSFNVTSIEHSPPSVYGSKVDEAEKVAHAGFARSLPRKNRRGGEAG